MAKALSLLSIIGILGALSPAILTAGTTVNCHDGSAINGIDGFEIRVLCNPLADRILFHSTLVEDFARRRLGESGIDVGAGLNPGSAMIWIYISTVEMATNEKVEGYATSVNIDVNRAALCLLGDDEFHAISSIVWEDDRLVVSGISESRELILDMVSSALEDLAIDLRQADPQKYSEKTAGRYRAPLEGG